MEALGTELAAEGFEAGVLAAVGDEVGALAEGFPTHLAFVGLLSSVDVSVFLHIRLLVEALAAVLAGIGPCVRMDQQMCGEGGGTLECLPTHLALKTSFLGVNVGVLLQAHSMPEGFATYFTSKGSGPTVRPSHVDLQAMGSGEHLVALHTVVGLHV